MIGSEVGQTYYLMKRYDEAESQLKSVLALDPNYAHGLYLIGLVHTQQHRYREAIDAMRRSIALGGSQEDLAGGLAFAYGVAGDRAGASRYTLELEQDLRAGRVGPFALALAYTGQGDLARAFDFLNRAIDVRDSFLPEDFYDPQLDRLRADPRFRAVEKRMGVGR